jgi:hypothetical protein
VSVKRWLGLLAVAAACLPLLAGTSGAQQGCGDAEVLKGHRGTWTVLAGPTFSTGNQQITAMAIDRAAPSTIFVTNGAAIARSTDAGCSWKESYRGASSTCRPRTGSCSPRSRRRARWSRCPRPTS